MVVLSLVFVAGEADARRLGGGATSGMKRQTPPPQPAQPVPAKPAATPGAAAAPAAAVPPKRNWLGPIAGIAAGLGLAALFSHLGMGEGFANVMTMLLLAGVAFFALRWAMRRFGRPVERAPQGLQFAGAGGAPVSAAPPFGTRPSAPAAGISQPNSLPSGLPSGFDTPAFERIAKLIFIRMQAANDAGNLEDLRQFATPEMFATFRLDLQDRQGSAQQTDVMQLDAQVLDFSNEADQQIVSVRFHGLIRETPESPAMPFDEIWHLVKPADGSREWAIAGIAQNPVA